MSFYGKNTSKGYTELLDTYLSYCGFALGNRQPVTVHKNYGRDNYERTPQMLFDEIIQELHKNYRSPDTVITNRYNRRFIFA